MSKAIVSRDGLLPAKVLSALIESDLADLRVGDILVDDDGEYRRVSKITLRKGRKRSDPPELEIETERRYGDEWSHYGTHTVREFKNKDFIKIEDPIEVVESKALAALQNVDALKEPETVSSETGLMVAGTKESVKAILVAVESKRRAVEVIKRVAMAKVNELRSIARRYEGQLENIRRVIGALELYLGVYEEILQIRDGLPASADTPIVFHQQVLYMDEEVGDPRPRKRGGKRGIDFRSVDDFDEWIAVPKNLAGILPELKGVVALKPSRQSHRRFYSEDALFNMREMEEAKEQNAMTYLLIRNGDRLYRIWTSMKMLRRLFPAQDEWEHIMKIIQREESDGYFEDRDAKDKDFDYKRQALVLQGLIDRTEVFKPMPLVNLFDPNTYGGLIVFLRDDEPTMLHTGREYYDAWKKRINGNIQRGSRIAFGDVEWYTRGKRGRFLTYYREHAEPKAPPAGVYTVEDLVPSRKQTYSDGMTEEGLIIRYNPGDTVYADWYRDSHPRKNRLGFVVYRSDDFILNYDQIGLDDVEYYIASRFEREKYLDMIPTLWALRDKRLAEIEYEKEFVKLVAGRNAVNDTVVWDAINWWKFKNPVFKRGLDKDDALALRMIERHIAAQPSEEA